LSRQKAGFAARDTAVPACPCGAALPQPIWAAWRLADSKTRSPEECLAALAAFFAEYDPSGTGEQPSVAFLQHSARLFTAARTKGMDRALGLVRSVSGPRPVDLHQVAGVVRAIDAARQAGRRLTLKQAMRQLKYRGSASTLRSTITRQRARIAEINTPYEVSRSVAALAKSRADRRRTKDWLGD
jgi:hypothetical protein